MPRYAFDCPQCGYETELTMTVSGRDSQVECPSCGHTLQRAIGAFAVATRAGPFRPQNLAQQLAGPRVVNPSYSGPTSVLRR